jgi:DNA-binding MarR family transcriptional regulator
MTETQTTARPFGQQLGETARATRILLDGILAEEGTTFARWVALNTLGTQGPAIPREHLLGDLAAGLQTDNPAIAGLLAELAADDLIATANGVAGEPITLTPAGDARYQHLRQVVQRTSQRVLNGIDPDDLQAALRVLTQVKAQAEALQAR